MKVRYMAIYKLLGANKLPEDAETAGLLTLQDPAITAMLTTNAEPYVLHIDKFAALGTQLLKGLFAPDKEGTLQERLAAEIYDLKARRAKRAGKDVYLIFDGEADISTPELRFRRDTDDFAISLDETPAPEIRERFRPFILNVLTALGLSLPANADRRVEKVGNVVYLVDPNDGRPIYPFTFKAGFARVSISSPLTQNVIAEAAVLARKLATNKTVARPTSLLISSLETTDELQAFIAAWSAIEIFVNAIFKNVYEASWFKIMKDGAPDSAKPVFKRFEDVMSDKYRLADKFLIIASVLDADAATADATEFRGLKKTRDELFHALDIPASPLPTEAVQKLLLKYMKLHLAAQ